MLSSTARLVCCATALVLALNIPARAAGEARLATVAAADGFTYHWMPGEAGAILTRPGVSVVFRVGRLFYEVNDATPIADSAPRFDGRDIVISQKLATHLSEIARRYPYPVSHTAQQSRVAPLQHASDSSSAQLTLAARQIPGREALALRGSGPANLPLTITIRGELSNDLPVVLLSTIALTTANDGTFFAEVDYSQDSYPGTTISATVTTLSGTSAAEARMIVGAPSPQIKTSALDDWPRK
jgi:hypothetical protein